MFKRLKQTALVLAVFLGAMIIVGVLVDAVLPTHWQPVQASVQSANIASVRKGTPGWAIQADASYEFDGRVYETRRDVLVDADRDVVLDALDDWPSGREFTLYVNMDAPESVSLYPDGGRSGAVAAAVILTPALIVMIGFIVLLIRRRREAVST